MAKFHCALSEKQNCIPRNSCQLILYVCVWNTGQNCNNCHSSYRDKALYFSKQMEVIAEFWASIRDTKMGKKKKKKITMYIWQLYA